MITIFKQMLLHSLILHGVHSRDLQNDTAYYSLNHLYKLTNNCVYILTICRTKHCHSLIKLWLQFPYNLQTTAFIFINPDGVHSRVRDLQIKHPKTLVQIGKQLLLHFFTICKQLLLHSLILYHMVFPVQEFAELAD